MDLRHHYCGSENSFICNKFRKGNDIISRDNAIFSIRFFFLKTTEEEKTLLLLSSCVCVAVCLLWGLRYSDNYLFKLIKMCQSKLLNRFINDLYQFYIEQKCSHLI